MNRKHMILSLLAVPVILSSAFALMLLSYLMVPLMVVGIVSLFVYVSITLAKIDEEENGTD